MVLSVNLVLLLPDARACQKHTPRNKEQWARIGYSPKTFAVSEPFIHMIFMLYFCHKILRTKSITLNDEKRLRGGTIQMLARVQNTP